MTMTADDFAKMSCPFTDRQKMCIGPLCAAWRWVPLLTTEPDFLAAVKQAMADGREHKEAVKHVSENRAHYGLPEKPWRGFCGAGGRPTDVRWVE